jgi:hypothetical protein
MRYEIGTDALELRYGPLLHYRIPFGSIRRLSRRHLSPTLWASPRLPGIALFTVPYSDVGPVKMCASAAARGILLIQTSRETYGITPEREDEFLSALEDRLPPETTAVGVSTDPGHPQATTAARRRPSS